MANSDKNWKNKAKREALEFLEAPGFVREGTPVAVGSLGVGEKIITRWKRNGSIDSTKTITHFSHCPGHNGNHVHVNDGECYDARALVWKV